MTTTSIGSVIESSEGYKAIARHDFIEWYLGTFKHFSDAEKSISAFYQAHDSEGKCKLCAKIRDDTTQWKQNGNRPNQLQGKTKALYSSYDDSMG
jgi:hypothetical protein